MKRAGILTFHNANNYGAVLQAFALQETLKKTDFIPSIINYDSPAMGLKPLHHPSFSNFCNKYLNLTSPVNNGNDIDTSQFDIIITGSDQVWNPEITKNDSTYFLDFAGPEITKASYAASIGLNSELLKKHTDIFKKYIPEFQAISLREASHISFIKQLIPSYKKSSEITASIDPSLLLTAEEYSSLLSLPSEKEADYIFLFTYNMDPKLTDFTNLLALHTGYKIVAVTRYPAHFYIDGTEVYDDIPPVKWLSLLKNANLVLTDSFHGLMLSIVFERPFYAYTPDKENVIRIIDALKMFGLEKRRITFLKNIGDVDFHLDYTHANEILHAERQKSMDFLTNLSDL